MMPIMPFQTVTAVALSILFKGSKITAAVGTWVSNPLTWYFLYYYSYKLGTSILGAKEQNAVFSSIMTVIRCGEEPMAIVREFVGAGGAFVAAFLLGGLVIGIVLAVPSYFVFFHLFKYIKSLKASRKGIRKWRTPVC